MGGGEFRDDFFTTGSWESGRFSWNQLVIQSAVPGSGVQVFDSVNTLSRKFQAIL